MVTRAQVPWSECAIHDALTEAAEEERSGCFCDRLSDMVKDRLQQYGGECLDDAFLETAAGGIGIPHLDIHQA